MKIESLNEVQKKLIILLFASLFLIFYLGTAPFCKPFKVEKVINNDKESLFFKGKDDQLTLKLTTLLGIEEEPPHLAYSMTAIHDPAFFKHYGGISPHVLSWELFGFHLGEKNSFTSYLSEALIKRENLLPILPSKAKVLVGAYCIKKQASSRSEILNLFLNQVDFGDQVGTQNASHYYFNKETKDLSVHESVLLATKSKNLTLDLSQLRRTNTLTHDYIDHALQLLESLKKNSYVNETEYNKAKISLESLVMK